MTDDSTTKIVRGLLEKSTSPRDALPYSPEFSTLKEEFERKARRRLSNADFWQLLAKVSKRGGLSRPGERKRAPKTRGTTLEQKLEILRLFPEGIGSRDNLPYTTRFDDAYRQFSRTTSTRFSKHEFWRAVSSVAKYSRKPEPIFDVAPLGGLPRDTVRALERMNPWWRAYPLPEIPSIRRDAFEAIWTQIHSGIAPVVALRGPRQVGKTTIQHQIVEQLLFLEQIDPRWILRVQFDDTPALGLLQSPIDAIVRWYEENVLLQTVNAASRSGAPPYLLFDEVQNLKQWSNQVKALADSSSCHIFVTGSSALRIKAGNDTLAGRLSMHELSPLTIREIARIRGLGQLPRIEAVGPADLLMPGLWEDAADLYLANRDLISKAFGRFSDYGGYPICHKGAALGHEQEVEHLYKSVVAGIVDRTLSQDLVPGITETQMREIFWLCCRYAGQRPAPAGLAEQVAARMGGDRLRVAEIERALLYLEESLLIRRIRPVEMRNRKNNQTSTIALCDHFVREAFLGDNVPIDPARLRGRPSPILTQAGFLMESTVAFHIGAAGSVQVNYVPESNGESEIDVLMGYGARRLPIEVKYQRAVNKADCQAIDAFCSVEANQAEFGLIVTQERVGWCSDSAFALPAGAFFLVL